MALKVDFGETVWQDADEIYGWLADKADPETALRYLSRIQDFCSTLGDFPHRGTPRDDLAPGIRTVVFEGRAVVAYTVSKDRVTVLRILNRGRDATRAFSS